MVIIAGAYHLFKAVAQTWPFRYQVKKPHLISESELADLYLELRLKRRVIRSLLIADIMIALTGFIWC
jgi:hypothetical protein